MKSIKSLAIVISFFGLLVFIFWGLGSALGPLLFSFALAYLTFPVIKKLESKGIKRQFSVPGIFLLILLLVILILSLFIPHIISDARSFIAEFPENLSKVLTQLEGLAQRFGYSFDLSKGAVREFFHQSLSKVSGGFIKSLSLGIGSSLSSGLAALLSILNLFLIPLFFFYFINDYEKMSSNLKSLIPQSLRPKLLRYVQLSNRVLNGYIRGQLVVACCLGLLYSIGLSLVGLRFGFLIGIVSGVLSVIPYAGFTLGFSSAFIVALANHSGSTVLLGIVIVFVLVQALEGTIITPRLVGDQVGLSALATMLALIIGGNVLGLLGMLVAIPVAAILKSVFTDLKIEYQKLDFYKS